MHVSFPRPSLCPVALLSAVSSVLVFVVIALFYLASCGRVHSSFLGASTGFEGHKRQDPREHRPHFPALSVLLLLPFLSVLLLF